MRRLPARSRTGVEHAVPLAHLQGRDNERRRLILDGEPSFAPTRELRRIASVEQDAIRVDLRGAGIEACPAQRLPQRLRRGGAPVRPQRQQAAFREGLGSGLRLGGIVKGPAQLGDRPGVHPGAHGDVAVLGPRGQRRRIRRQLAENSVHEALLARARELHRFSHGRVRGRSRVQQLVRAQAQDVSCPRAHADHGTVRALLDRPVERSEASDRAVRELRGEAPVALIEAGSPERRRDHQARIPALLDDPAHRLERHRP